ncbi:MAG: hypothetical protein COW63_13450 [Bacteroidetes bacterium CG18_big_fil_WC_8_21_14_2_50_41_14]|nr:MAG: hypothetical protein COW63_13450 [Bacteroidetes bacterium CG18_big_fil_WC_8_21_14_2_50_41_14]
MPTVDSPTVGRFTYRRQVNRQSSYQSGPACLWRGMMKFDPVKFSGSTFENTPTFQVEKNLEGYHI